MPFTPHKISYGYFQKAFILTVIIGFFLVTFYFYYEKYEVSLDYFRSQKRLHPELFKNTSEILQPKACIQDQVENISLIFIPSAPQNRLRRQIIRSSWAQQKIMSHLHFQVIFIIEEVSISEAAQINLESETFGDILRTHFIGSHSHLIYKTMVGFQWAVKHCPVAEFLIKINDDVFVNSFALRQLLDKLHNLSHAKDTKIQSQLTEYSSTKENFAKQTIFKRNHFSKRILFPNGNNPIRDLKFIVPDEKSTPESQELISYKLHHNETDLREDFNDVNDWTKTIFCFVWRSSALKESYVQKTNFQDHNKNSAHPPYCSDVAYILPRQAASLLIDSHLKNNLSNVFVAEGMYITGLLASDVGINHVQIGARYAFNAKNIEAMATGDVIFAHLGKDMEPLTHHIWLFVQERKKYSNPIKL